MAKPRPGLNIGLVVVALATIISCAEGRHEQFGQNTPSTQSEKGGSNPPQEPPVQFSEVEQILGAKCLACHSEKTKSKKPLMDSEEQLKQAVDLGNPAQSILLKVLEQGEMPPRGPAVTEAEYEVIKKWVFSVK